MGVSASLSHGVWGTVGGVYPQPPFPKKPKLLNNTAVSWPPCISSSLEHLLEGCLLCVDSTPSSSFHGLLRPVEAGHSVQWLFIPRIQKTSFSAGENNLGDFLQGSPFTAFMKDLVDTQISVISQTLPLGPHWPCSQTSPKPWPWP